MIQKYQFNFSNDFKSCISDNFFGTMDIIKKCLKCGHLRYSTKILWRNKKWNKTN